MPGGKIPVGIKHDEKVFDMLCMGPMTKGQVARALQIPVHDARAILRRMKSQGKIYWRYENERAQVKYNYRARKDPSPFPKPWWWTPDVGFFS